MQNADFNDLRKHYRPRSEEYLKDLFGLGDCNYYNKAFSTSTFYFYNNFPLINMHLYVMGKLTITATNISSL